MKDGAGGYRVIRRLLGNPAYVAEIARAAGPPRPIGHLEWHLARLSAFRLRLQPQSQFPSVTPELIARGGSR